MNRDYTNKEIGEMEEPLFSFNWVDTLLILAAMTPFVALAIFVL